MGQTVRITISEGRSWSEQEFVSSRRFEVESKKQLTKARAKKILAWEQPELGSFIHLVGFANGWVATEAIERNEKCHYHYTWRHYYIAAD